MISAAVRGTKARSPNQIVLGDGPDSAARARRAARTFLHRQVPAVDERAASDVEQVVSELVTNSVRHAHGPTCVLSLDAHPDAIEVAVLDADPAPPCERTPDLNGRFGGFGWPMVCRLAKAVTVVRVPGGKAVCALMPRRSQHVNHARRRRRDEGRPKTGSPTRSAQLSIGHSGPMRPSQEPLDKLPEAATVHRSVTD
ncbi:ATP-binding protein [Streptomyces sp. NPDC012935]|uniref:ATP-binding protein n=1 Tax=Streptomyces sp. NPDC012935 TaxID=3364857 RepID=UPI0036A3A84C